MDVCEEGLWPNADKSGQRGGCFSECRRPQRVAVYGSLPSDKNSDKVTS